MSAKQPAAVFTEETQPAPGPVPEFLRAAGAVFGILAGIGLMAPGFHRFGEWRTASDPAATYYQFDYFGDAMLWLVWGLIPVVLGGLALWRKWMPAGVLAGLIAVVGALYMPGIYATDTPRRRGDMHSDMKTVQAEILDWAHAKRRLPETRDELLEAVPSLPVDTRLMRNGQPLPMKVIFTGGFERHIGAPPQAANAGEIYYSVAQDGTSFSLGVINIEGNASRELIVDARLSRSAIPFRR